MILLNPSPRQIQKKQKTKVELKSALIDLIIMKRSIEKISIIEIAEKANLNRGTFYTHFKDKYDLLDTLLVEAIDEMTQEIRDSCSSLTTLRPEDVLPTTALIFEHIEKNKKLFNALDILEFSPNLYDRIENMFYLFFKDITIVMDTDSTDTDNGLVVSYYLHAIIGIIKYWIKTNFKYSSTYMSEQLTSLYSNRVKAFYHNES